jgi:hypothetical protein
MNTELLAAVAEAMMSGNRVKIAGKWVPVRRTRSQRLRTVAFVMNGEEYEAIEQNPEKPSRWGQLARSGHRVVQFKKQTSNRFVAVSVDGKVKEYGALGKKKSSD